MMWKIYQGIRENVYKPAQEALSRGQTEEALRIFIDGVMSKEGFFDQLPSQAAYLYGYNSAKRVCYAVSLYKYNEYCLLS